MANQTLAPILIAGPTASGKSGLALRLAERLDASVVNADALQVYRCWRILTARPSGADLARAPHLLYGHVDCDQAYSVGAWLRDVAGLKPDRRLIFVGGTGLYLTALTRGLAEVPPVPDAIRAEGNLLRAETGSAEFLAYLDIHDPILAARVDRNNAMRLQRAWEVHRATGRALSAWQDDNTTPLVSNDNSVLLRLDSDAEWLNDRIAGRFSQMLAEGALDEVAGNMGGWDPGRPSARALGAAELVAHLRGTMSLAEAEARAIIATRQFAKRQRTWFRSNMAGWTSISAPDASSAEVVSRIVSML